MIIKTLDDCKYLAAFDQRSIALVLDNRLFVLIHVLNLLFFLALRVYVHCTYSTACGQVYSMRR